MKTGVLAAVLALATSTAIFSGITTSRAAALDLAFVCHATGQVDTIETYGTRDGYYVGHGPTSGNGTCTTLHDSWTLTYSGDWYMYVADTSIDPGCGNGFYAVDLVLTSTSTGEVLHRSQHWGENAPGVVEVDQDYPVAEVNTVAPNHGAGLVAESPYHCSQPLRGMTMTTTTDIAFHDVL